MKNLQHLANINEAANELHKRLLGSPWYIRTHVEAMPPSADVVTTKEERKVIVVTVRTDSAANGPDTFNSWPVRYQVGI